MKKKFQQVEDLGPGEIRGVVDHLIFKLRPRRRTHSRTAIRNWCTPARSRGLAK